MIISVVDRDKAILENLVATLSQIKQGGIPNERLVLNKALSTVYSNQTSLPVGSNGFVLQSDLNHPAPPGLAPGWLVEYFSQVKTLVTWDADTLTGTVDTDFIAPVEGGNPMLFYQTAATACTVDFYVDEAKTIILFSQNTTDNPDSFTTSGSKTFYIPPDEKINFAPSLSDTYSQPVYYVTATFNDATTQNVTYRNSENLLFEQVLVYTKPNPANLPNADVAYFVPSKPHEEIKNARESGDRAWVVLNYDLYVQIATSDCALGEVETVKMGYTITNMIRNALYADRYRDGICTGYNENLNGTFVSPLEMLPSDRYFFGKSKVQCVYLVTSTTY